jgi:hypothetical protein
VSVRWENCSRKRWKGTGAGRGGDAVSWQSVKDIEPDINNVVSERSSFHDTAALL